MNGPLPTDLVLVNESLVADPDADRELGPRPAIAGALADEEISGARFLLTLVSVDRVEEKTFRGLAVAFDAFFHAPPGARFSDAELRLVLIRPADAVFHDVAPVTDSEPTAAKITVTREGKLMAKLYGAAKASASTKTKVAFTENFSRIRGSGAGTNRARWTLVESRNHNLGISHSNRLMVTVAGSEPLFADVTMRCQLLRPGLAGALDRVRELVFGPQMGKERWRQVEIVPPPR